MMRPQRFLATIVYMLQQVEYKPLAYVKWLWRVDSFRSVMYRQQLDPTPIARALMAAAGAIFIVTMLIVLWLGYAWLRTNDVGFLLLAGAALLLTPYVTAYGIIIPVILGNVLILQPQRRRRFAAATEIYRRYHGTTIAIAGSYGKTTMKELLAVVLNEGKKIAYTQGNFNTPIAHARFAERLKGNEEVLIVEYGEFEPDDVARFAEMTQPDWAIITGLNEAHLDTFGSLDVTARTIFGVAEYLQNQNTYVSAEDPDLHAYTKPSHTPFSKEGVDGWKVSALRVGLSGTTFTMKKKRRVIKVKSGLLGEHNVAPLALVAALAAKLGMTDKQIERGLAKSVPFEHRLEPRMLPGNVTLLDDTYNGSIDGVRAGLAFLGHIKAKRKLYVTPGLVEQGDKSDEIHQEMGELIAGAADAVYIMNNSTTEAIQAGLAKAKFKGEVTVIDQPLEFYENLNLITSSGDVVLMQNDWTDNYA